MDMSIKEAEEIKSLRKSGYTWSRISEVMLGNENQFDGRDLVSWAEEVLGEKFDEDKG
jgi:hypothetical protein